MYKILVVDDERSMRELLERVFSRQGYTVRVADNGSLAIQMLKSSFFDLVISDVRMPGLSGMELLQLCREVSPDTVCVLMTAFATIASAREAFKMGADDFIQKPFDIDELKVVVAKALEKSRLRQENALLKRELKDRGKIENIIGHSRAMQEVFKMLHDVASTASTVLIYGESGTGKELIARAVHNLSPRSNAPFVSVNCGAFTETLLESELFGYVKGAFTGAQTNRKGLFEAANGGTIFLDEISEMTPAMQVKLLRVLQEKKVRPVGSVEEIPVDTRVVAATNRDLAQMVEEKLFRHDLYYRVNIIQIKLPPLRERKEDIPLLAEHFLKKFAASAGKQIDSVSEEAMRYLENYDWPGNVRELENAIERAVAFEQSRQIQPERLPETILKYSPSRLRTYFSLPEEGIDLEKYLSELEKTFVLEALRKTMGNQTKAADLLRLPVRSLRHLLDKHKIRHTASMLREGIDKN
ncbi:MAG: sigma-54 dependent transcriptional regulator [Acidobacteriota bacterium]|nr:sigma-54 dependent transcriptional regulator [Blastocatellia bacterium]MDW8413444.1 sigma-54 dependent transcriptional regulator [Acidobacteriota bacterium]